jgi:hypothetical protein
MTYMLCRNRVKDFTQWKNVFSSHKEAHKEAGLRLVNIWRCIEEAKNVFFMFEVTDMDKTMEFINSPEAAEGREVSGVVDGEYHFIDEAGGY